MDLRSSATMQQEVEKSEKEIIQAEDVGAAMCEDHELLAQKERKVRRKLDMTLMPIIWLLYLFNYLDRNNIA